MSTLLLAISYFFTPGIAGGCLWYNQTQQRAQPDGCAVFYGCLYEFDYSSCCEHRGGQRSPESLLLRRRLISLRRGAGGQSRPAPTLAALLIAAVAIWAGGERILPHEVRRAARLAHRIVQMAHGGRQVIKPQLLHQRTDAALREARLIAASVGISFALTFSTRYASDTPCSFLPLGFFGSRWSPLLPVPQ